MVQKLMSSKISTHKPLITIGDTTIGGDDLLMIAGPCSIENRKEYLETAVALKNIGIKILRGGAYKPRTSPYDFQGLEREGLDIIAEVKEVTGLAIVTEVMDTREVEAVSRCADVIQVGSRNMQNYALLKEIGKINKPVILKRGQAATIREWLLAAEYIMLGGNQQVILCERGIRTYESYTRNTFDISAIPILKQLSKLPIIADPSHASGKRALIAPLSRAAIAAGADGLMIEVHLCPQKALSDGKQSITPQHFSRILREISPIAEAVGRKLKQ
jgi:3-deoxy-7-phosphoheptulonate synthase